jgi:hypothetical protein
MAAVSGAAPAGLDRPRRGWRRVKRVAKAAGIAIAALAAAVTAASFGYNLATDGPAPRPAHLLFAEGGGWDTRYLEWGTRGTPVILVPGALETADTFARLGPALAPPPVFVPGWHLTMIASPRQVAAAIDSLGNRNAEAVQVGLRRRGRVENEHAFLDGRGDGFAAAFGVSRGPRTLGTLAAPGCTLSSPVHGGSRTGSPPVIPGPARTEAVARPAGRSPPH